MGRENEAALIRNANIACAMGKLLLGDISSWQEFFEPDLTDYSELPRRQLKSGKFDIKNSLRHRIDDFCKSNFIEMTQEKLVLLYEEVKAHRGLEVPYSIFSKKYSAVRNFQSKGYPKHSTVCISLWGLQYRFPEHDFSNDLITALEQLVASESELDRYQSLEHKKIIEEKNIVAELVRKSSGAKRQIMQASFSLLECYLNGIAWEFHNEADTTKISNAQIKTIKDVSNVTLRDKVRKYPVIIFGVALETNVGNFVLDDAKQYRDSLMHPSPFSAPEKFGGYDKLDKLYNLDSEVVTKTVYGVIEIIEGIESMKSNITKTANPIWLPGLNAANTALQRTLLSSRR